MWMMDHRLIVQITGESRSGKSEVSRHLAEEYGFEVVLVSDIIRAYADLREIILAKRDSYLDAHQRMKGEFGPAIVADTILEASGDGLIVDGIRVPADVKRLRQAEAESVVIALNCPLDIRFQRAMDLGSPLDRITKEEFAADDTAESYSGNRERQMLATVIAEADYHIDSSKPLETVIRNVDEIVEPYLR